MPAVDALIKVSLLLGLAGIATLVLGRASAAVRHLVWTMALTSALVLPVLSLALPRWQLPIVTLTENAPLPASDEAIATAPPLGVRARAIERLVWLAGRVRSAGCLRRAATPSRHATHLADDGARVDLGGRRVARSWDVCS